MCRTKRIVEISIMLIIILTIPRTNPRRIPKAKAKGKIGAKVLKYLAIAQHGCSLVLVQEGALAHSSTMKTKEVFAKENLEIEVKAKAGEKALKSKGVPRLLGSRIGHSAASGRKVLATRIIATSITVRHVSSGKKENAQRGINVCTFTGQFQLQKLHLEKIREGEDQAQEIRKLNQKKARSLL